MQEHERDDHHVPRAGTELRGDGTSRFGSDCDPISATALATKFADHFLPICQASVDLLEVDERDFEARCRRMLDADGTAMIDALCTELQTVGEQMQILVDGLELTRARLRTAMARVAITHQPHRPESTV